MGRKPSNVSVDSRPYLRLSSQTKLLHLLPLLSVSSVRGSLMPVIVGQRLRRAHQVLIGIKRYLGA